MGNSFGCSASGERLVSAARDGDLSEAKMLLNFNPCLARYSTFGGLNSPLHFAAAKGHNEIVTLLLEHGADVNSRNYCGQTALMQACQYGHWEVVQSLLLFRCNVLRADYLSGRTALHFAAANGHARCIRLVVADFAPSPSFDSQDDKTISGTGDQSSSKANALSKVVNKAADGGITALHIAALNGHFDSVHLLLDLQASVSAMTFHYGTSMDLIGAGSTPLHYAACGGNLKCCQILLARGSSRLSVNCNGCLPIDVARMWGRHWLEQLLAPTSDVPVPKFPSSNYLSLPLMSALNLARDCGFQFSGAASDDAEICAVCLERTCNVAAEGCGHELCVKCALYICSTSNAPTESSILPGSIPCPLCRRGILYFLKLPGSSAQDIKLSSPVTSTTHFMVRPRDQDDSPSKTTSPSVMRKNHEATVTSDTFCPVQRSLQGQSHRPQPVRSEKEKVETVILEKTTCPCMF